MDIGSLLLYGAIAAWSGFVAYFVLERLVPKREEAAEPAPEIPRYEPSVFPSHTPEPKVSHELPQQPVPDVQMTEGFKAFQTGAELTVEDIVKGLSRKG